MGKKEIQDNKIRERILMNTKDFKFSSDMRKITPPLLTKEKILKYMRVQPYRAKLLAFMRWQGIDARPYEHLKE